MKFKFAVEKAEALGFIDVAGVNIEVEVAADESITFLKQILPICKEIKERSQFVTSKNFEGLCKELNEANDKANELKRAKDIIDSEKARLQVKVNEMGGQFKDELREKDNEISELKAQLKEANLRAKLNK